MRADDECRRLAESIDELTAENERLRDIADAAVEWAIEVYGKSDSIADWPQFAIDAWSIQK